MTASRGEPDIIGGNNDTESDSISDKNASMDTPVAQSVVARFPEIWLTAVLAVALAVLLVAFVVDVEPVVRYGIGLAVFALYLWWFVSNGVAVLDRLEE